MKNAIVALVGVAGLAAVAAAQTGSWSVSVSYGGGGTSVNPTNPVARIRVSAEFTGAHAFAAGRFNVVATEAGWTGAQAFPVLGGPNTNGTVAGGAVNDIRAGQVHFPPAIPGNPANPMVVWEMDWTTANFTSRSVGLSVTTLRFAVYPSATSPASRDITGIGGGQGSIAVTPAPSALALLGLGGLVAGRRRR